LFTTTETGIKGILDSKKSMFLNFLFMKVEFSEGSGQFVRKILENSLNT
jgi:hypothetical protein